MNMMKLHMKLPAAGADARAHAANLCACLDVIDRSSVWRGQSHAAAAQGGAQGVFHGRWRTCGPEGAGELA